MVVAPEHPVVKQIVTPEYQKEVEQFLKQIETKSDLERTSLNKDKSGVFTGSYAVHPVTEELIPIWIGDYVLYNYGTGAVMAVPAHDQRDYEFAHKYDLPIHQVIEGDISEEAYVEDGTHIHSEFLNGLNNQDAIEKMI